MAPRLRIWAIVPVKPPAEAKRRLAPVLDAVERERLSQYMFRNVLEVLTHHPAVAGTIVISRDLASLTLPLPEEHGMHGTVSGMSGAQENEAQLVGLHETGHSLNAALHQATPWAHAHGGDAVLVLPADVPLVRPDDITAIARLAQEERCIVIAPCRREEGTNALLVRPPGALDYAFGPGSFVRHCSLAGVQGLAVHVYRSASLALDIDEPDDLAEYNRLSGLISKTLDASRSLG